MRELSKESIYLFERMPIRKAVIKQVGPSIFSQMVALLYNLSDTYFVGILNSPIQTAAMTVAAPLTLMLTAIANIFAIGGASLISSSLGKKEYERAKQIGNCSFWYGIVAAILYSSIVMTGAIPLLNLCGADESIYPSAHAYIKWVVGIGGISSITSLILSSLIRSEGYSTMASIGLSIGGILNIILDPIFVLPNMLNMGIRGAGLATALSNLCSTLFLFVCLFKRCSIINLENPWFYFCKFKTMREISVAGMPSAIQYLMTVVAAAALSKFMSSYGAAAIAAIGIVKKIDMLPLFFSIGVSSGILPLLAYGFSKGNVDRCRSILAFACIISISFSGLCLIGYEIYAPRLVALFINEQETVSYAVSFLRIMVTAMPMMSICHPLITYFQATGRISESIICSLLRKGVLDIPLLFIADKIIPMYGCAAVQPIVDSIALFAAAVLYKKCNAKSSGMIFQYVKPANGCRRQQ